MKCPVINIEDGKGSFIVINKSDFAPKSHKEFKEKPVKREPPLSKKVK